LQVKRGQKERKRTRFSQKKAKPGAFWVLEGMRTVENRGERMGKPGGRTKVNTITMQHMKKENRRKPSVFAGFWQWQKDLVSAAASVGSRQSATGARSPHDTHCAGRSRASLPNPTAH